MKKTFCGSEGQRYTARVAPAERARRDDDSQGGSPMEWVTPQHEEIDLNCEISSYANAEL
ncbi:MAG: hypothetical protein LAN84_09300 [Acidobacteriia bacterium]|nr:hypothetical protein [Terriglobia bacterium]